MKVVSLFSGCGGLDLGFMNAGFEIVWANDIFHDAAKTYEINIGKHIDTRNITEINVDEIPNCDGIIGGFPCQGFSVANMGRTVDDKRNTLYLEFIRIVKGKVPKFFIAENVKGILTLGKGVVFQKIKQDFADAGYEVFHHLFNVADYGVPQKRERLIIVGVRKDIKINYKYPTPYEKIYTLKDALKKGELYKKDVPNSSGSKYPEHKKRILDLVPPKGYWRDLPVDLQKEYMGGSFYLGGGKTGMARRIGWDEPSLTLTCSPAQKQTERCHPDETRPFTVREYARIQTFPDDWKFSGSTSQCYKQIGNAVPCNLAKEIGYSLINLLNQHFKT